MWSVLDSNLCVGNGSASILKVLHALFLSDVLDSISIHLLLTRLPYSMTSDRVIDWLDQAKQS